MKTHQLRRLKPVSRRLALPPIVIALLIASLTFAGVLAAAESGRGRLPAGYLIGQQVGVYNTSKFGAISTAKEADALFGALAGKLSAVEFEPLYYQDQDLRAARVVADSAGRHGVELWASTFRLVSRLQAFGRIPAEFQACVMEADGRIVPALDGDGRPLLDVLNPEAVDRYLARYRAAYIQPMKGLLQGIIFNEDVIPYQSRWKNERRPDYWRNATFSPRVLDLWKEYCRAHDVRHEGRLVAAFPVHQPPMVAKGGGKTQFFPGYLVPPAVVPGQAFVDLPRARGVWKAWQEFLAEQFAANWIAKVARAFHEVNGGDARWHGALYFGLHNWSLPYEQILDRQFQVPAMHQWGAWGLQRGCDLERIARMPEIDVVVCETYPPLRANLENFIAEFARITRAAGKQFGLMVHRDDDWPLGSRDREADRWAVISKYHPAVIGRFPIQRMLSNDKHYQPEPEKLFQREWENYKSQSSPPGKFQTTNDNR